MTFIRGVFLFALLMLIAGIVGSRYIVAALLGSVTDPAEPRIIAQAQKPTPTPTATLRPTSTATATATPQPTATKPAPPTLAPTATPAPASPTVTAAVSGKKPQHAALHHAAPPGQILHHVAVQHAVPRTHTQKGPHHRSAALKAKPTPTLTPLPTPSPTPGIVTLVRYWVGTPDAHHGQTISVGYVIDNETGQSAQVMLGASIKADDILSWAASLSDPSHDVVADVPPGVSTHVRYFTLPAGLKPGSYAVAWGLRNAVTGERTALVAAPAALQVTR